MLDKLTDRLISLFYVLASAAALYISMRCLGRVNESDDNESKISLMDIIVPIIFGPFYIAYKLGIDQKCHKLFFN